MHGKKEENQQFWFSGGKVLTAYLPKNERRYRILEKNDVNITCLVSKL